LAVFLAVAFLAVAFFGAFFFAAVMHASFPERYNAGMPLLSRRVACRAMAATRPGEVGAARAAVVAPTEELLWTARKAAVAVRAASAVPSPALVWTAKKTVVAVQATVCGAPASCRSQPEERCTA
jgi:hypothetical protein